MLTVGSLFSGIGGLDLGLERAGMRVLWQCESDPYCRAVLHKHWPDIPCYPDVRELTQPEVVDVLVGGFPCQDLSVAGHRAGLDGERSGLWASFARLIRELRPRYVFVENVPALLVRGMGRVLGDLAASGYDAEWDCLPAATIGSPQLRARTFVVAYSASLRDRLPAPTLYAGRQEPKHLAWWNSEPGVGRVADGISAGVDRRRVLGNAVVPQVAEYVGRQIVAWGEAS